MSGKRAPPPALESSLAAANDDETLLAATNDEETEDEESDFDEAEDEIEVSESSDDKIEPEVPVAPTRKQLLVDDPEYRLLMEIKGKTVAGASISVDNDDDQQSIQPQDNDVLIPNNIQVGGRMHPGNLTLCNLAKEFSSVYWESPNFAKPLIVSKFINVANTRYVYCTPLWFLQFKL
jgi:hypothetical protein